VPATRAGDRPASCQPAHRPQRRGPIDTLEAEETIMLKRIQPVVAVALLAAAWPAAAQDAPRAHVGLGFLYGMPVGEFRDYVRQGFGLGGHVVYALDPAGVVAVRADLGFLNYGNETRRVCLSATVGCRITVDLTTNNNIFGGSAGLQLQAPRGPVRPYANAGIGFSYFGTESSVRGTGNNQDFARTTKLR
jgi:hypothetical protein